MLEVVLTSLLTGAVSFSACIVPTHCLHKLPRWSTSGGARALLSHASGGMMLGAALLLAREAHLMLGDGGAAWGFACVAAGFLLCYVADSWAAAAPAGHSWTAVLLTTLLSAHSVLAGLAMAVQPQEHAQASLPALLVAVVGHKFPEGFALGLQIARDGGGGASGCKLPLLFALSCPVGTLLGLLGLSLLRPSDQQANVVAGLSFALAVGAFLFVALWEVLLADVLRLTQHQHQHQHHHHLSHPQPQYQPLQPSWDEEDVASPASPPPVAPAHPSKARSLLLFALGFLSLMLLHRWTASLGGQHHHHHSSSSSSSPSR